VSELVDEWPNNPHASWLLSQICRISGDLERAVDAMQRVIDCSRELPDQGVSTGRLTKELSWCHFIALQWDKCAELMTPLATDGSKDNMLRLWGLMLTTVSWWMIGDMDKVAVLRESLDSVEPQNEFDQAMLRKLKALRGRSSANLAACEMLYHLNRFTAEMPPEWQAQVLAMIEQAEATASSPSELLIVKILRAGLLLCSPDTAQHAVAHQLAVSVLESPDVGGLEEEEKWVLPNAHLLMAKTLLKIDDPACAVQHLEAAGKFSNYVFENAVIFSLKNTLDCAKTMAAR